MAPIWRTLAGWYNSTNLGASSGGYITGSGNSTTVGDSGWLYIDGNSNTTNTGNSFTDYIYGSGNATSTLSYSTVDIYGNSNSNTSAGYDLSASVNGSGSNYTATGDAARIYMYGNSNTSVSGNSSDMWFYGVGNNGYAGSSAWMDFYGSNNYGSLGWDSIARLDGVGTNDTGVIGGYSELINNTPWYAWTVEIMSPSGFGDLPASSGGGSAGFAAGVARTMNTVAQYDLSVGDTAGAAAANQSWNQASAAIAASSNPSAAPPSPFNGIALGGPVVKWSFADNTQAAASPYFSGAIGQQYQATIEQALQTWSAASGLTFVQVADSAAPEIQIGWGDLGTSQSGLVGYTSWVPGSNQPIDVRLEDPTEDALVAGSDGTYGYAGTSTSLYQAALHEIGHALGLGESSDPNSIMFPLLGPNNTAPDATDLSNLAKLYGASQPQAALWMQAMASGGAAASSSEMSTVTPTLALPPQTIAQPSLQH